MKILYTYAQEHYRFVISFLTDVRNRMTMVWVSNLMLRHKLYIYSGLLISLLIIYASVRLATTRTSWFGKASSGGTDSFDLSLDNSYLFVSPLTADADGVSSIQVSSFILNQKGLGVSGVEVKLNSDKPLSISEVQPVTDSLGRAIIEVRSQNSGVYTLTASVKEKTLPQTVSVQFR